MRTPYRLAAVVAAAAALSAAPSAAFAAPERAVAGAEPTSTGEAVVGFVSALPAGLTAGSSLRGYDVVRVDAGGAFAVVKAADVAELRADLAGLAGLRYVEDNVTKTLLATPNDPRYGSQYGPPMMGAPAAWDAAGYGSSSVVVSVIDTGIRRTHQDLSGRVLGGYDYVNNDSNPADDCDHGTHVSGTVAATTNNGVGVAGMSQASILPYKVLSPSLLGGCSGSADDIASAIRAAADNGAKVISMSIGGPDSTVERDAVRYAYGKGVTLVAASGNGGSNNGVDYPAAYSEVVAVAALTSSKTRASYSDGGPQVDIAAPGSDVISTVDDSDSAYGTMSGTSMATPHVSGALALALSCAPGATRAQLLDALYTTAEDLGTAGRDDIYGHGLARVDRVVGKLCSGSGGPTNTAPTASFTATTSGLTVSVDGSGSSDPDGDPLTYSWSWGDGTAAGSGATAAHSYAAGGTYTVTLTVSDGRGGTGSASKSVTVSSTSDPDPSTPNLTSGTKVSVTLSGTGDEKFFKIAVPSGTSKLDVVMTGPSCGLLGCSFDADLYTRHTARPTDTSYACRPYKAGSNETCTHSAPASGYWYIRVDAYTGGGTVALTATVS